jgi:hypothetical protein
MMTQLEKDIRNHVVENIKNYVGIPVCDIHHNLFNQDYWVIGYYNAEQEILKHGSVFDAIAKIKEYEDFNFGEIYTDVSSSERVCNMLVYILGDECLNGCKSVSDNWDDNLTDDIAEQIINELK